MLGSITGHSVHIGQFGKVQQATQKWSSLEKISKNEEMVVRIWGLGQFYFLVCALSAETRFFSQECPFHHVVQIILNEQAIDFPYFPQEAIPQYNKSDLSTFL